MVSKTRVLYGEYPLKMDEKNRLLIPAEVRRSLDPERDGEAFFVIIGTNNKPWLYPERGYEEMVSSLATHVSPGEEQLAFDQMYFSMSCRVAWDAQGRWNVPETSRRRAQLNRDITMIGARDHLELWNTSDWEIRREELIAQSREITARQREAAQALKAQKQV